MLYSPMDPCGEEATPPVLGDVAQTPAGILAGASSRLAPPSKRRRQHNVLKGTPSGTRASRKPLPATDSFPVVQGVRDNTVVEARQAYRAVLARWGLEHLSPEELRHAGDDLRGQGATGVTPEDVDFEAALARLVSRRQLPLQSVETAFHELLQAEMECDQAEWERDCQRSMMFEHTRTQPVAHKPPESHPAP